MIAEKQHAHALIERLDDVQVSTAVRFLELMLLDPVARSIAMASVDEEPLSAEDEQALDRADAWLRDHGGRGIPHEQALADFRLTEDDLALARSGR